MLNHDSNRMSRAVNIIEEGVYLKLWQERQDCKYFPGLLHYILNNKPFLMLPEMTMKQRFAALSKVSQRDAYVAASVIQWLGTSQGAIFMDEAENRILAAKKKEQEEWHQKWNVDALKAQKQQDDLLESL